MVAGRVFSCVGHTLWNSLPLELRSVENTGNTARVFIITHMYSYD